MPAQEIVELLIDASQANAGALAFEQSANRIQQSSERATASVDKLGQSIDRAGQKMSQAGQRSGAAAMEQHAAATDKATASMRQLAEAHETTIRRMQTGSFNVLDQTATLGVLAQYRSQLERGVGPSSLVAVGAPERAGRNGAAAAITADSLPLLTDDVFNSIHPSASLSKATRFARQAAAADPSVGADIAKIHSSEAVAAAALPSLPQAAGAIATAGPDQLLAASLERLALANDRAARATEAASAASLPGINSQVRSQVEERAAYGATTAAGEADFTSPSSLRGISSQVQRDRAIEERAAYGVTTAANAKFASEAALNALSKANVGGETIGDRAAAFRAALPPPHIEASQVDVSAWLRGRQPNEFDAAAWTKARQPSDLQAAGAATKDLAQDAEHGAAASGHLSTAVHEVGHAAEHERGSLREFREEIGLISSAGDGAIRPIEALRFGLIGLAREFGAPGIAASLFGGAIVAAFTLIIKRADEVEANLRSFEATTKTFGTGAAVGAEQLQQLTEEFKHTGVSAEDAKKSIDAVARSQVIQPSGYKEFLETARNASAFTGANAAQTTEEFVKAFSGGTEPALALAESFHALSAEEIVNIRYLDQHGHSLEALGKIFEALRGHIVPWKDELSEAGKSARELATSWDDAITALSQSSGIERLREFGTWYLRFLRDAAEASNNLGQSTEKQLPQVDERTAARMREVEDQKAGPPIFDEYGRVVGGALPRVAPPPPAPSAAQNQADTAAALAERGTPYPGAPAAALTLSHGGAVVNPTSPAMDFGPLADKVHDLSGSIDYDIKSQEQARDGAKEAKASSDSNTDALKALTERINGRTEPGGVTLAPGGALTGGSRATAPEEEILAMIRQREGGSVGPDALHYPAPGQSAQVLSLSQVEQATVTKNSHAFGDYGFEPSTYRLASKATGVNPEDISEQAQHTNALYMLRTYGANAPITWQQSGSALGRPYPEIGAATAATEPQGSAGIFGPPPGQQAALGVQNQQLKDQVAILSQIPGVAREAAQERQRLAEAAPKLLTEAEQKGFVDQGMLGFWQKLATQFDAQHRLNDQQVTDADKIAQAFQRSAAEGLRMQALVQAQQEVRERGGAPGETAVAQADILNQQAAAAISASRQQQTNAEPAIAAAERLAQASLRSRDAEEQTRIENEAAQQTQDVLNKSLASGSEAYIKEATAIDAAAQAQIRRRAAAEQGLEAGHQIQSNQDQSHVLALELGLQGQSSDAIRTQVELLRARQEIEQRYTALTQDERNAIYASTASVIQQNAVLTQAQEATARLNDAFRGIAGTIDGDLTNSIRNALIRTPAEAGEHLKHFWDEWRAGFKAALGDIVSGLANAAFIKPLTGEIAGALGLGQVAQQTGTFGGLLTGGPAGAAGAAGGAGLQGLSGSQLALNVSGLTSGSSVFGANVPGSTVFQSGNNVTVQGTGAAVSGPGEAATATTGSAGLSADQIQAILDAQATPLAGSQTTTPLAAALLNISSATGAAQPTAASTNQTAAGGAETVILNTAGGGVASAASILQPTELPAAAAAVTGTAQQQQPITPTTATAAASSGLGGISNIGSVVGLLDKLNSNLPGFLPSGLGGSGGSGGLFGNFSDVLSSLNPFATAAGPIGGISGAPFSTTVAGPSVPFDLGGSANAVSQGSLFGLPTSATVSSVLAGAGAGFGAGSLLNSLLGGNPIGGDVGSAGGGAIGSLIGSVVPGVGTLVGGLLGGLLGGGLGGLVGGPPEGQSAGAVISPTGAIQTNTVGGSSANIQQSGQIAQQIGAFVTALNQLTNAQGQKIGTNLATAVVSSNNQRGITVTGTNGVGGQYDQNAAGAVSETELQIVQNLQNVSGTLKTVLANISDPSQLQAAVQFADVYDKLNVTSAQLTASLTGNVNVIGPFQQALVQIQATFSQLTAQAAQFGVDVTPITTALQAVTTTLNTDFKTSLDEAFQTAVSGGNDFIASLVQVHQAFAQNTSDAAALGLTNLDQQIQGIAALQAGTTLATLGIDQLTTVIQDLGQVAPEVAAQAQALISSGNALPDILTQATQALIDPLGLAIEKEKAAGDERVVVAQQTGQSLVEVEELNSANLIQAITSAAGNPTELNAFTYANNPTAQEYLQVAPALAGFSAQQLEAVFAAAFNSSPALAALAQSFVNTGAALPDTITQSLEGIVNPLELAIQQQTAQAQARTQVGVVAGQNLSTVAALNTASITQAIVQQLGSPEALQALAAHGSAAGLTALQAGPAIAGLGLDQLTALINAIGTAAPNLTAMINALIASGNALPDALTQATEAIVESGVLAVQKAQALAYEQVQAAGPAGQNVSEAQTLGAAEVAQATAQATGTEVPLGPLPDWITQLEEAFSAPLQLAIQKQQAAGIQQVQIAEATGASLVAVQQENADAIAQIWYQATQQLTSLKNDLTTGSLSGLTAANQVTASIEQFNTVLGLVQSGNTSFINDLASAGQAAVQAAQTAYGNGPQTQSVREQVYQAITPLLVSSSGYPSSDLAAVAAADTTSGTATGTTTDLQNNTTALENLTAAITSATPGSSSSTAGTSASAGTTSSSTSTGTASTGITGLTTNPVTGESFTGTGITAVAPNYPTFPSASTLSGALADAVASQATAADWATINQAVQAGILNAANQPGYALVIQQAQQWAAGQSVNPSAGLAQALSDAVNGTPTLEEWELINQAVNAGILSPLSQPQYASVIRQAQVIADAQATSLSQIPNNETAYNTTINGLPAFAAGSASTPPGPIMVGEQGPEWYQAANDNRWSQVGVKGPEIIDQPGGAQIIPFPMSPPGFAGGTTGFYVPPSAGSESDASNKALIAEVAALRKQVWAGQMNADQNAKAQHVLTRQTNQNLGPPISAPVRRAVG